MRALNQVPLASIGMALVAHDADDVLDELASLFNRPAWMADALCREHPELDFFAGGNNTRAKAVCAGCLVRDECTAVALAEPQTAGIWGGLSERQREAVQSGARSLSELVAALPSPRPPATPKRPVARSGAGACRICARVCRPDEDRPHDRLNAGLCPACHQAWLRWRKTHDGDRQDFIRQRTAA